MIITSSAVASSFSNVSSFERPYSAARSDQIHFQELNNGDVNAYQSVSLTLEISKTLIDEEGGLAL
jgi:hypothetical protein